MIKTRNLLEAGQQLIAGMFDTPPNAVTISYIRFAVEPRAVIALPQNGTLVAPFSKKAIKRVMKNPRDTKCFLLSLAETSEGYEEAFALVLEISPPEEADGTGRPVYYASYVDHTVEWSGLLKTLRNPKRKADKAPALGYMGAKLKIRNGHAPRQPKQCEAAPDIA